MGNSLLLPWNGKPPSQSNLNESPMEIKVKNSTAANTGTGFQGLKFGELSSSVKFADFLRSAEKTPSPNQIRGFLFSSTPGRKIGISGHKVNDDLAPQCLHMNGQDTIKLTLGNNDDTPSRNPNNYETSRH